MLTTLRRRLFDALPLHFASPMPRRLTAERYADNAGIVLFVLGTLCYLYAGRGMHVLEQNPVQGAPGEFPALAQFDRLLLISRAGLVLGALGVAILVASALIAHRARARARRALEDA